MIAKSAAALAIALSLPPALAWAQEAPPKADVPKEAQRSESKPAQKMKVLKLDEFTVEGRIQKPQAFFILQRSNLSFEDPDKKESFLPKIVKSCDKDPF